MEKNRFWIISLVALSVINTVIPEKNKWLIIAIIVNSFLILFNIVVEIIKMRRRKGNE